MDAQYYKDQLNQLNKSQFDQVQRILDDAAMDSDIDLIDIDMLNDIADDIYYER